MEVIRPARPEEGEALRRFAEAVFGAEGGPVSFAQLLPKVYRTPSASASHHLLLQKKGELQGMLLRSSTCFAAAGQCLQVGHIGSVCVARQHRGQGAMGRLLETAIEQLRAEGCALIALSGQRRRYQRYGFVPAGAKQEFCVESTSLQKGAGKGYSLRPLAGKSLANAIELFGQRDGHMLRPRQQFADILCSWGAQPWALYEGQQFMGYCTAFAQQGGLVASELRLLHPRALEPLCALLLARGHQLLKLCLAPGVPENEAAAQLCERYILGPDHGVRVLHFAPLADALLRLKATQTPLPPGRLCLCVQGMETLELWAEAGRAGAQACTQQQAKVTLAYEEAVHLLFSHLSAGRRRLLAEYPFLAAWLPLPLYLEANDCY